MLSGARLEIEDIVVRRSERVVLGGISLTVEPGELLVLMGSSGAGKTTLLSTINRLIDPDEGTVRIGDLDVRKSTAHLLRRGIGYCFQGIGLFPHLTVAENITVAPRLLGWDRGRQQARVTTLLEQVQLDGFLGTRMPHELSGGQAQRVALARALAAEPPVLLLDEPFAALDAETRERLQDLLRSLHRALGMTVVLVSHNLAEALRLGTKLAIMVDGKIAQAGPPADVVSAPASEAVSALFAPAQRNAAVITAASAPRAGSEPSRAPR